MFLETIKNCYSKYEKNFQKSFISRDTTPKSTYDDLSGSNLKPAHSSGKNKLTLEALAEVASQPEKYNTTNAYVKKFT